MTLPRRTVLLVVVGGPWGSQHSPRRVRVGVVERADQRGRYVSRLEGSCWIPLTIPVPGGSMEGGVGLRG
jgi:hypothetical protein